MKLFQTLARSLALFACLGMLLPSEVLAENPAARSAASRTLDVALHDGGLLVGQVVNTTGTSLQNVEVTIVGHGRALAKTRTDGLGRFAVKGLTSGNYYLATNGSLVAVRTWSQSIAPPAVAQGAMLVSGTTVRAQDGYGAASFNQGGYGQTYNTSLVNTDGAAAPAPVAEDAYVGDGSTCQDCYGGGHVGHGGHGRFFGGNHRLLGKGGLLSSPWVLGAGVAAAIAIPFALDDDDAS